MRSLEFVPYSESCLCIVNHLAEYLQRTKDLRGDGLSLFISYQKPYKAVSTETISRWLKTMLAKAGVDITLFKAHSTRSAATSKAKACGMPISDILKKIGWTNAQTFAKFYDKNVIDDGTNLGHELITQFAASNSHVG
jgi:hypothetical protein